MKRAESGTLLFDGDCGFCTSSANVAARIAPGAEVLPYQRADLKSLGVDAAAAADALQWVAPDGRVSSGAEAVARLLVSAGGIWVAVGRLLLLPGVRLLAAVLYRIVAANRHRLPGGTPACRLD